VYAILITASAIPIIGLSEYLLTITTGAQHYATPENEWATLIGPYLPGWFRRVRLPSPGSPMRRYARFPDFELWFTRYREMTLRHPSLLQLGKLRRLRDDVIKALEFS